MKRRMARNTQEVVAFAVIVFALMGISFALGFFSNLLVAVTDERATDSNLKKEKVASSATADMMADSNTSSPLCGDDCWVISDSPDFDPRHPEILNDGSIREGALLYAIKKGHQVAINKRNIRNGSEVEIFRYIEDREVNISSGNYWSAMPPSIALSPNGMLLVFSDEEGLKMYDMQTEETHTLVKKIQDSYDEVGGYAWSDGRLFAHSLKKPRWSADAKYISFLMSHYEGASIGLYDTVSSQYLSIPLVTLHASMDFVWNLRGNSFIWSWGDTSSGLFLYTPSVAAFIDAVTTIGHPLDFNISGDFGFLNPSISHKGDKITFIAADNYNYGKDDDYQIGFVPVNESGFFVGNKNFSIVDKSTNAFTPPFFSRDDNFLFYSKRVRDAQHHLFKYAFDSGETSVAALLPAAFEYEQAEWVEGDTLLLALVGSFWSPYGAVDSMGMFVLDIENRKIAYASPVYHHQSFTFLGFVE